MVLDRVDQHGSELGSSVGRPPGTAPVLAIHLGDRVALDADSHLLLRFPLAFRFIIHDFIRLMRYLSS